jgi:heterodisulfide reductase subunit A
MEVERICASNGPTDGQITLKNGQPPKSAAVIHCVGREQKGYCSSVCCMASLKLSHFIKAKLPEVKITHFYSDLCIPGKDYQHFYEEVKGHGVDFVRAAVTGVAQSGKDLAVKYKTEDGQEKSLAVEMVILNPALEPGSDSAKLAGILNIPQGKDGFFSEKEPDLSSIDTAQDGVFIAGCAQGPKDIAETVAEAEATAGRILSSSK